MKLIRKFINKLTFNNLETDVEIVNRLFDGLEAEQRKIELVIQEANDRTAYMNAEYEEYLNKTK